ncbi:unnamed protein product [Didymodactylos carnosus]|uniref:Uncharacterized protein n=1 Tax=Didymodactylos carnosus TaxID=1234261 RepID=A0A813P2G8_9BILA|nr:unnamed protein product [Didymodactylos carnosus]CAF3525542.1 unnamed protein product [Didymodactylos carnosus]
MLTEVCTDIIDIPSINVKSKNNYKTLIKGNRQQSNSKWKAKVDNYKNLRVGIGACVVITENMCKVDRLVKGAFDTIVEIIMYPVTKVVQTVRATFDNPACGFQHQQMIKSATVYNVCINFMLLEGFEILDSPAWTMKTI